MREGCEKSANEEAALFESSARLAGQERQRQPSLIVKNLGEALLRPGILRLFLASIVVLQHARIFALGAAAVDVFFVLSGYWVCRMWQEKYRERTHPITIFLASRFWRLWPTYVVCQLIGLAVLARFFAALGFGIRADEPSALAAAHAPHCLRWQPIRFPRPDLDARYRDAEFYLALPVLAWAMSGIFRLPAIGRQILLVLALAGLAALYIHHAPVEAGVRIAATLPDILLSLGDDHLFLPAGSQGRWTRPSAPRALVGVILLVSGLSPGLAATFLGPEATRTARARPCRCPIPCSVSFWPCSPPSSAAAP